MATTTVQPGDSPANPSNSDAMSATIAWARAGMSKSAAPSSDEWDRAVADYRAASAALEGHNRSHVDALGEKVREDRRGELGTVVCDALDKVCLTPVPSLAALATKLAILRDEDVGLELCNGDAVLAVLAEDARRMATIA